MVFTYIFILCSSICIAQKQRLPKVFISNPDFHNKSDTLADGRYAFIVDNIDGDFLTSVALLYYFKDTSVIVSSKNLKNNLLKYEDLISIIKKNKNNFFEKYEYYILEPHTDGYFKAFKVVSGSYFEVKDKAGLDILSDF